MRGLPDDLRDRAHAWAERSAQAQGLGPTVEEGAVLRSVATLLDRKRSGAPDRGQPGLVELVVARPSGANDQVIEDGSDDALLPGQ
jgi:hypothetical protein